MEKDKNRELRFLYLEEPGEPAKVEFDGPWTATSLKRMIHKAQRGLKIYKRDLLRRDRNERTESTEPTDPTGTTGSDELTESATATESTAGSDNAGSSDLSSTAGSA
jgi:hypothetical protein